jgi:hypothetical protein
MSGLDDIRRKRRKKGEPLTLADLTAPEREPGTVGHAPRTSSGSGLGLEAINFAAYLRHVASQDPQRRALAAARRTQSG